MIAADDPRAVQFTRAVQSGDVDEVARLIVADPTLATDRYGDDTMSRTALHIATDWPAHFPRVTETIRVLARAGAPLDGRFSGPHRETPLHWAASADDVDAINALLDEGADIEADGAIFTDGTPMSDAVVFAQWNAARVLRERGATLTVWQAAALGQIVELTSMLDADELSDVDIDNACWHACRAGQLEATQTLIDRGANVDWLGYDHLTTRQAGIATDNDELAALLATIPLT